LPALFLLSFLAATLLPIGSEWLLVALIIKGQAPETSVLIATLGNYLGACTTYAIGFWGAEFLTEKVLKINQPAQKRAQTIYKRFGLWSLLFSWLPLIGDPLCLVGGVLRLPFGRFSLLVFSGKLARYALVAQVTVATISR
jgi:membrane protein YqaA with SNARE-associated domain